MTYLALSLSNFVNMVAKLHGEVSRKMFPNVPIEAITNGVHAATWASPSFRELFDRMIPSWREDNYSLRGALGLPPEEGLGGASSGQARSAGNGARKKNRTGSWIPRRSPSVSRGAPRATNART